MESYNLKQAHGVKGCLYLRGAYSPNYGQGTAGNTVKVIQIQKIVCCGQQLAFSLLGRSRTLDGIAQNTQVFLIDIYDLPIGTEISAKDYVIVGNKQYDITAIDNVERFNMLMLTATEVSGKMEKVLPVNIVQYLQLTDAMNGP